MVVPGLTLFLAIGSTHVPSLTSSLHSYPSVGTYCVDPSVVGNATIKSIFLSVFIVINLCFQCFIVVFPLGHTFPHHIGAKDY